jgi:hypothetical protein
MLQLSFNSPEKTEGAIFSKLRPSYEFEQRARRLARPFSIAF